MIRYGTGDATAPSADGPLVIVHVCNDIGGWGAGFVLALSRRWKAPEREYRQWAKADDETFALGEVQFVEVEPELWVANLVGQRGIRRTKAGPPVRYEAIRTGLARVAEFAKHRGASIHMPRIGAGLAGGDWSTIESIVTSELADLSVTVYDLP